MTIFTTPDLSDLHPELRHLPLQFRQFGLRPHFAGPISTIACHADNSRVSEAVSEPGEGRVLLVDGANALHRSLLGDRLAQLAADHQWAGVVVLGAIRDVEVIDGIDIGVQALGVCPVKTEKRGAGERDIPLTLCEMTICPGDWLYADRNGVLIGPQVSL
ncbi:MAG: ribonuclease E activity regulator RraA [Halieaceae bacterium]|jgi:regulator of ribonuclease activity A|nr:ribonuclease E activity regulator RraA [Halieaceae bacterium]MBT5889305.1 ribonuclease E activity regulator RraA [Halieaceae bacterium]